MGIFSLFSVKKSKTVGKNVNSKTDVKSNVKTAQEVLPFEGVYKNGIIETVEGIYTKSYTFDNTNFANATNEDQERIFLDFGKMLNSLESNVMCQIISYNQTTSKEDFKQNILLKERGDNLDVYRQEYNNMLLDKAATGTNNTNKVTKLIVSIPCDNIEIATKEYARLDGTITTLLRTINKGKAEAETTYERLNTIYKILHPFNQDNFLPESEFDLDKIAKQGITVKEFISSSEFEFPTKYFIMNGQEVFGRVLFLDNLPSSLAANVFTDFTNTSSNTVVSCTYKPIDVNESVKLLKNQTININGSVIDAQKKASKEGYGANLISPDLQEAQREAEELRDDITNRNQKLFLTTVTVIVYGKDLEELDKQTTLVKTIANKHLCLLKELDNQQREGLCTALPFARKDIRVDRLLTTESASVFLPFSNIDICQPNGVYYGQHADTKSLIMFDRYSAINSNGVVLGAPGGGKSFASKREIIHALLAADNECVYIIDPEREYKALAELLGGQIITISLGSQEHINPLDLDISDTDENPLATKSDYIIGLVSTMVGSFGLSGIQVSVLDRCIRLLYEPYYTKLAEANAKLTEENASLPENKRKPAITCLPSESPTLVDLFYLLKSQMEPEARNLALSMERFCIGNFDLFAHKANVEIKSKFVVYDTKEIGTSAKELGIQVCLNDVWNHMFEHNKKGIRTRFYIDEFYLLLQNELSAKFLQMIWKRARKWGGAPTGITQNVEDLLNSHEGRTILNTSEFVMLLSQSPMDRAQLADMFNLSETEQEHINHQGAGHGLLIIGGKVIPFHDEFPTDTKLFKVMTTKPGEALVQLLM